MCILFRSGDILKSKIIVFNKKNRMKLFILVAIIFIGIIVYIIHETKDDYQNYTEYVKKTNISQTENIKDIDEIKNEIGKNIIEVEEYSCMPREIKQNKVIGELVIPSIGLDTYILEQTNNKTLNISVTKLTGPKINTAGNFCITGHNYFKDNMFGKLKKLNKDDKITLIDTYGRQQEYVVYDKFEVSPNDTSVINQNTNGKKEVTLITCTIGALKRIIVKAVAI